MYKEYKNSQWLYEQYITMQKSTYDIGNDIGCSNSTIFYWLQKFEIPIRKTGAKSGKDHHYWEGDKIGYKSLHRYITRTKEKPEVCMICNEYKNRLECCSIDHSYTRNINDWIYLCTNCHRLFDRLKKEVKK